MVTPSLSKMQAFIDLKTTYLQRIENWYKGQNYACTNIFYPSRLDPNPISSLKIPYHRKNILVQICDYLNDDNGGTIYSELGVNFQLKDFDNKKIDLVQAFERVEDILNREFLR